MFINNNYDTRFPKLDPSTMIICQHYCKDVMTKQQYKVEARHPG